MTLQEVRKKYVAFFESQDHALIPSAGLQPENDATTLFTGSGMQPLLPHLLGEKHPKGTRLVNSQKCFRAEDIDEVGDNRHTTFFEMLGNWSLGDYFKKEQLPWFYTFLTKEVGLDPARLYITVFSGDPENNIPADVESVAIWKDLFKKDGIDAHDIELLTEEQGGEQGMQGGRIFYFDAKKNWWSRAGEPQHMPAGEPGGPDSEVFFDFHPELGEKCVIEGYGTYCHPNCDCGRFMEIGNNVFMQYIKKEDGSFEELPQKNIDFGGGLERIVAAKNNDDDVFTIDVFANLIREIETLSNISYKGDQQISFRIIADHVRGAVFMLSDGIMPTNTDAGYVTRRLLRRAIIHLNKLEVGSEALVALSKHVIKAYGDTYTSLAEKKDVIEATLLAEHTKFSSTLKSGLKRFEKIRGDLVSAEDAFVLFTTYGFPIEMTEELAEEKGMKVDMEGFKKKMEDHRKTSRAGAEHKFKGGLADTSAKTTMLHTATHLMLAGLRKYLGDDVHQAGSNITEERTRFDFTHNEKVNRDTLDKVEAYVNEAISAKADVAIEQMPKTEAKEKGVEGSFWEKYPDVVNVYVIKDDHGVVWSQELCGGPHVKNTGDIKGAFTIGTEKASSAGVRRVKATLETV